MKPGRMTAAVLFAGVLVSFALLIIGIVMYLTTGARSGGHFLEVGLLALLGTPFLRLVVLATEFARRREYAFVAIAAGVLLLLGVSVFVGLR